MFKSKKENIFKTKNLICAIMVMLIVLTTPLVSFAYGYGAIYKDYGMVKKNDKTKDLLESKEWYINNPSSEVLGVKIYGSNLTTKLEELEKEIVDILNIDEKDKERIKENHLSVSGSKEYGYVKDFTQEEKSVMYSEANYTINNIKLDKKYLDGIKIFVGSKKVEGILGYAEYWSNPKMKHNIYLFHDNRYAHEKFRPAAYRLNVRGTILHEIGHVINKKIDYSISEEDRNKFWKEYKELYPEFNDIPEDKKDDWEYNIRENFAEDFKLYQLDRMDNNIKEDVSLGKNTAFDYNPQFEKFLEKWIKVID